MINHDGLSIYCYRVNLKQWSNVRNVITWTVNKKTEKEWFKNKDIPYFTDSPLKELPEAWVPPQRRMSLTLF